MWKRLSLAIVAAALLAAGGPEIGARIAGAVADKPLRVNEANAWHRHRHCRRWRGHRGRRVCRPVYRRKCFIRAGNIRVCRRVFAGRRCHWTGNRWGRRCYWHRHRHGRNWHGHR